MVNKPWTLALLALAASTIVEADKPRIYYPRHVKRQGVGRSAHPADAPELVTAASTHATKRDLFDELGLGGTESPSDDAGNTKGPQKGKNATESGNSQTKVAHTSSDSKDDSLLASLFGNGDDAQTTDDGLLGISLGDSRTAPSTTGSSKDSTPLKTTGTAAGKAPSTTAPAKGTQSTETVSKDDKSPDESSTPSKSAGGILDPILGTDPLGLGGSPTSTANSSEQAPATEPATTGQPTKGTSGGSTDQPSTTASSEGLVGSIIGGLQPSSTTSTSVTSVPTNVDNSTQPETTSTTDGVLGGILPGLGTTATATSGNGKSTTTSSGLGDILPTILDPSSTSSGTEVSIGNTTSTESGSDTGLPTSLPISLPGQVTTTGTTSVPTDVPVANGTSTDVGTTLPGSGPTSLTDTTVPVANATSSDGTAPLGSATTPGTTTLTSPAITDAVPVTTTSAGDSTANATVPVTTSATVPVSTAAPVTTVLGTETTALGTETTTAPPPPPSTTTKPEDSLTAPFEMPTTLLGAPEPTTTFAPPPTSGTSGPSTVLPTYLPKAITPAQVEQPDGTQVIYIGFKHSLNFQFVYEHTVAVQQIFEYLPVGLTMAVGVPQNKAAVFQLSPFNGDPSVGWITTIAHVYFPTDQVNTLASQMSVPASDLYNMDTFAAVPDQQVQVYNLTQQIRLDIDLQGNLIGDGQATNVNGESSSGNAGGGNNNNDAFAGNGGSGSSGKTKATAAGIALGAVGIGALYGAAMFIIARRYKRKRASHQRSSSVVSSQGSSEMRYTGAGSPALMGGALLSRDFSGYGGVAGERDSQGSYGSERTGNSARTANISAPVAAENSLGWN